MPFVTEKIWLSMPHIGQSIMVAEYPQVHAELEDAQAAQQMPILIAAIKAIRQIRSEANAPLATPVDILIETQSATAQDILTQNQEYIERLGHPKQLTIAQQVAAPKLALTAVIDGAQLYVPLAELVDIKEEIKRQQKELTKVQKDLDFVNHKLNNPQFVANAPEKVVAEQRHKLQTYQARQAKIQARITELQES